MSADANNTKVVIAALAGNLAIASCKLAAALLGGSASTLAEAVHSFADSGNQVLLLLGMKRANRRPTDLHPFGHAVDSYFFPFLVSILLFSVGGLFALYEGWHGLHAHEDGKSKLFSYVVLGLSFIFEAFSFRVAYKEFGALRKGRSIYQTLMHAKDPTIPVVLLEDSAALLGLFIALIAVAISDLFHWPAADGIGSILIGVLLVGVAYFLAARTYSLLLGEAISEEDTKEIEALAKDVKDVVRVAQLLSMHLGPLSVLLAMKVEFADGISRQELEEAINRLEDAIRAKLPHMQYIFIEPDSHYRLEHDAGKPLPSRRAPIRS